MLFSDPKWGNGCIAIAVGMGVFFLIGALIRYFGITIPRPVGSLLGFLIFLAIARFVLNQIFD